MKLPWLILDQNDCDNNDDEDDNKEKKKKKVANSATKVFLPYYKLDLSSWTYTNGLLPNGIV